MRRFEVGLVLFAKYREKSRCKIWADCYTQEVQSSKEWCSMTGYFSSCYAASAGESSLYLVTPTGYDIPPRLVAGDNFNWPPEFGRFNGVCTTHSTVKMAEFIDGASNTFLVGEECISPEMYLTRQDGGDDVVASQTTVCITHNRQVRIRRATAFAACVSAVRTAAASTCRYVMARFVPSAIASSSRSIAACATAWTSCRWTPRRFRVVAYR
jgi:hypothetical protein